MYQMLCKIEQSRLQMNNKQTNQMTSPIKYIIHYVSRTFLSGRKFHLISNLLCLHRINWKNVCAKTKTSIPKQKVKNGQKKKKMVKIKVCKIHKLGCQ